MKAVKISDMPDYLPLDGVCETSGAIPIVSNGFNSKLEISSLLDLIRDEFSPGKAVITCKYCGQWGARFCECKKCGAPIE